MKAVLISKYYKGHLDKAVEETGSLSRISGRLSGDTTGYVLEKIGQLMQKDKPYTLEAFAIVSELSVNTMEAEKIIDLIGHMVRTLNLCYFSFKKQSVSYEPWL